MDDSATCFIDPNARSGALVPCPLISIHAVDMPIQALLESTIGPRLGRKILRIWQQQSRIALSKLGAVDRKDPVTMTGANMPITLLEIKTAFGPEDTQAMTAAFEDALKRLNVANRKAPMATAVAKKIVRLAKRGERNPTRLTEGVIRSVLRRRHGIGTE
jgi:hypothetical protein